MCNLYARFEKLDSKVELTYDYVKIQVKTTYGECPPGSSTDKQTAMLRFAVQHKVRVVVYSYRPSPTLEVLHGWKIPRVHVCVVVVHYVKELGSRNMLSTKYENYLIDLKHYVPCINMCFLNTFLKYVFVSVCTVFKRFDKKCPSSIQLYKTED